GVTEPVKASGESSSKARTAKRLVPTVCAHFPGAAATTVNWQENHRSLPAAETMTRLTRERDSTQSFPGVLKASGPPAPVVPDEKRLQNLGLEAARGLPRRPAFSPLTKRLLLV